DAKRHRNYIHVYWPCSNCVPPFLAYFHVTRWFLPNVGQNGSTALIAEISPPATQLGSPLSAASASVISRSLSHSSSSSGPGCTVPVRVRATTPPPRSVF